MEIIRGTTPTIQFSFSTINAEDITVAYLVISQNGNTVIERSDGEVIDGKLSYTLTQDETLALNTKQFAKVSLDWKAGATRGRSKVFEASVQNSNKNEVI